MENNYADILTKAHSIVLGYAKCFGQYISVIILQYYMFQFNETISLTRWYSFLLCLFFRVIEVREWLKITEILSPDILLIILLFPLPLVLISPYLSQNIWTQIPKVGLEIIQPTVFKNSFTENLWILLTFLFDLGNLFSWSTLFFILSNCYWYLPVQR